MVCLFYNISLTNINPDVGYFPTHFKSMVILVSACICSPHSQLTFPEPQVYEEHSTFRGRLRDTAREIVKQHYALFPPSDPNSPVLTQRERRTYTAERVAELLDHGGRFLQNGMDEQVSTSQSCITLRPLVNQHLQGSTNNLTHPALDALCFEFFYSSDDSLGTLFPQEFQTFPEESYVLACTVVRGSCCLHYGTI